MYIYKHTNLNQNCIPLLFAGKEMSFTKLKLNYLSFLKSKIVVKTGKYDESISRLSNNYLLYDSNEKWGNTITVFGKYYKMSNSLR